LINYKLLYLPATYIVVPIQGCLALYFGRGLKYKIVYIFIFCVVHDFSFVLDVLT